MCNNGGMDESNRVSSRDLRNKTAEVIGRVERGESLIVTVDRRPVARLEPLPARSEWVPKERIVAAGGIPLADPRLGDDLRAIQTETSDDAIEKIERMFAKYGR